MTSSPCRESFLYQANEAIIREIATKGGSARFRKIERGKFELVKWQHHPTPTSASSRRDGALADERQFVIRRGAGSPWKNSGNHAASSDCPAVDTLSEGGYNPGQAGWIWFH